MRRLRRHDDLVRRRAVTCRPTPWLQGREQARRSTAVRHDPQPNRSLVAAIRDELARHADPDRAPQMQAYMKSKMPCRGVPAPVQGEIAKRV
ncbi:MAG: DNA alkylation repair protein, partial [Thermoleophilia bacterium]